MIKLICLAFSPVLAAMFCAEHTPKSEPDSSFIVENADRQFLAALNSRESSSAERAERADRELLAQLQAADPVPLAIPVRAAIPVKAVPVKVEEAVPRAWVVNWPRAPRPPTVTQIEPTVRRAIPVKSRRASIVIYRGDVVVTSAVAVR